MIDKIIAFFKGERAAEADDKIPKDLQAAIQELKNKLDEELLQQIKDGKIKPASVHFTAGMSIRNKWGLWSSATEDQETTRLAQWFNDKGIYHADDMSGIILESLWREIRNEPIDLEGQIEYYREYWHNVGVDPDTMKSYKK